MATRTPVQVAREIESIQALVAAGSLSEAAGRAAVEQLTAELLATARSSTVTVPAGPGAPSAPPAPAPAPVPPTDNSPVAVQTDWAPAYGQPVNLPEPDPRLLESRPAAPRSVDEMWRTERQEIERLRGGAPPRGAPPPAREASPPRAQPGAPQRDGTVPAAVPPPAEPSSGTASATRPPPAGWRSAAGWLILALLGVMYVALVPLEKSGWLLDLGGNICAGVAIAMGLALVWWAWRAAVSSKLKPAATPNWRRWIVAGVIYGVLVAASHWVLASVREQGGATDAPAEGDGVGRHGTEVPAPDALTEQEERALVHASVARWKAVKNKHPGWSDDEAWAFADSVSVAQWRALKDEHQGWTDDEAWAGVGRARLARWSSVKDDNPGRSDDAAWAEVARAELTRWTAHSAAEADVARVHAVIQGIAARRGGIEPFPLSGEDRRDARDNSASDCLPQYVGACVPPYPPDIDCKDISGPVRVTGADVHKLDRDRDGWACKTK